ncbi:D-alanyl-lipoteichoic acid biosynthesis protein DltD [Mediterraneibacter sp. NSJ-55]|uniref:D-alanyl-lipoteichoic acid biosynthesis protein DltD n=1 Tax=Mediterraneibacter hominis TaxID=2763054 RepID=A0A923LG47_9FIRM|nr:D-alanyl-lipoteichoic acid biosynthesis protein DltD [Mediterraneibacter hominis]MBC5687537.1 D-alanyl-lipoteichoic acid biosynthesis protein DltD [Mediterraneibacter hominis]
MKKQLIHGATILLGTIIIFMSMFLLINRYIDNEIEKMYTNYLEHEYGTKSNYVLEKSVDRDNLIILGSSELSSMVEQNPVNMFPNSDLEADVTIVGRAYVQSLLQSMNIATLGESAMTTEDPKTVAIVSLQWFQGDDIDIPGFLANFSELQFYTLMYNEKISFENKKYICERLLEILETTAEYEDVKIYSTLYGKDTTLNQVILTVLQPYYRLNYEMLKFRDKYELYNKMKSIEVMESSSEEVLEINWEKENEKAEQQGKMSCTNNPFYVEDEYYNTYIKDKVEELKNTGINVKFESKEREDFIHFLSICKDLGIKPYIIMMNTNGYYYDYIGINQDVRGELYDWVSEQCKKYDIDCLTLEEKEYEPYFMHDAMHLGWKGWLYVDYKISEYY